MKVLDEARVAKAYEILQNQYTVLGSSNSTINSKRGAVFAKHCNLLNTLHEIPEGYCPFYWDGIACWNATAQNTVVHSPCVSWAISKPPPEGEVVERKCLSGFWENMTSRSLEMLYNNCNPHIDDEKVHSIVLNARYAALLGYCLSALALLLAFLIFIYLKKVKCGPNRIHLNLFIAFFLRFVLSAIEFIYAVNWRGIPEKDCLEKLAFDWNLAPKLFSALWNYSIIASYGWVFIEGLYLHNSIYFNVFKESKPIFYILGGWIVPLVVITVWSVVKSTVDNTKYWIEYCDNRLTWIIRGPMIIVVIAEVIITVSIIVQLYSKVKNETYLNEREKYRRFAKSFLYVLLGIGGSYFIFDIVLGSISFFEGEGTLTIISHCVYLVINSLWGIVISYIYCFNNIEIKSELLKKLNAKTNREKSSCRIHSPSPLSLSLPRKANEVCAECVLKKKLLELNYFPHSEIDTDDANTVCSTVIHSEQNTFHKVPQRVYPRVTNLSFCPEEGDDILEDLNNP